MWEFLLYLNQDQEEFIDRQPNHVQDELYSLMKPTLKQLTKWKGFNIGLGYWLLHLDIDKLLQENIFRYDMIKKP